MCKEKKTLILTNKEDITADYVVLELQQRSIDYFRFNTEDFPEKIIGTVYFDDKKTLVSFKGVKGTSDLDEVYSIWYRRPGIPSIAEEIEDPGVKEFCKRESEEFLEGVYSLFKGLWVSYPPYIFQAQNKIYQLDLARNLGFDVPDTIISNDPERIREFLINSSYQVIAKAVRQGILEINRKEHVIFTNPVGEKHLEALSGVKFSPCIFQEYIQKKFDLRVTVIGDKVFPVEIHTSPNITDSQFDWRRGDQETLYYKIHQLPGKIEDLCRKIVHKMKLNFGAIDLVCSDSCEYYFLEINPNGQWAWIEQKTGLSLTKSFVDLLTGTEK